MKKSIALGTLGGTICMVKTPESVGVVPTLSAQDFIEAVPELAQYAEIYGEALLTVPSAYLQFQDMLRVLAWCREQVARGVSGIVLTQGTDSLEDSAYFLNLLWDSDVPLVMTGAMRHPESAGADGAANLLAAVIVASSDNSRGRGVQVVMNDQIYEANWVSKSHTTLTSAFEALTGACGQVLEGRAYYFHAPVKRQVLPTPSDDDVRIVRTRVPIYEASYSDEVVHLQTLATGADGLVIAGFGSGHVSDRFVETISSLNIPVLMSSRTRRGSVTEATYGYVGAEVDLLKRGVIYTSWLNPNRARILLWVILVNQLDVKTTIHTYLKSLVY